MTAYQLKLVAIGAMLIDHIAFAFLPEGFLALVMHGVGRVAAPIMCFFIAEGYHHTRSFPRYLGRLLIFAAISQIPFSLFSTGSVSLFPLNVVYTLAVGLGAIYCYDNIANPLLQSLAIFGCLLLSLQGDWIFLAVLFCLLSHLYRHDFKKLAISFLVATGVTLLVVSSRDFASLLNNLYFLGMLLFLPLVYFYNGKRGGGKYSKWLFYLFYPLHLLLLTLISLYK